MADPLSQVLDPPLRRGEDAAVPVTVTGLASDPSAWAVRFTLARAPGAAVALAVTPPAPTVTGTGPHTATWAPPLTAAQTAALAAGVYHWELARTDAGSRDVLAAGAWAVLDPVTDFGAPADLSGFTLHGIAFPVPGTG